MLVPRVPSLVPVPGVPVVDRPDGTVQIGSSPRSAVRRPAALPRTDPPGVVPSTAPATGLTDPPDQTGLTDPPDQSSGVNGDETGEEDEALAWSAYDPTGPSPRRRLQGRSRAVVAVAGSAVVTDALLDLLAEAGVRRFATDRPHPLAANAGRPADVVVLVDDHVARPLTADGLLAEGYAHLSVVLRDTDVVVGPFVLPGRSACLRCLDRRQHDADAHWPHVREALARAPQRPVDAATARVVAGIVGLQVLAHLDGGTASTVGTTLEVLLPEGRVQQRWWRPHPDCGCIDLPVPR